MKLPALMGNILSLLGMITSYLILKNSLIATKFKSSTFPGLLPLAELMTGGNNTPKWTTSKKVDVIAVDILPQLPYFRFHSIKDIPNLQQFCSAKIGPDVALRCFLVEDMTAVVVETLGTAFAIPPQLFTCHMQHEGHVQQGSVGEPFEGLRQSWSRFRDPYFFSFAFQRQLDALEILKSGPRQRYTMYRDHNVETRTVEERVSGIICSRQSSSCRIGMSSCYFIL